MNTPHMRPPPAACKPQRLTSVQKYDGDVEYRLFDAPTYTHSLPPGRKVVKTTSLGRSLGQPQFLAVLDDGSLWQGTRGHTASWSARPYAPVITWECLHQPAKPPGYYDQPDLTQIEETLQ